MDGFDDQKIQHEEGNSIHLDSDDDDFGEIVDVSDGSEPEENRPFGDITDHRSNIQAPNLPTIEEEVNISVEKSFPKLTVDVGNYEDGKENSSRIRPDLLATTVERLDVDSLLRDVKSMKVKPFSHYLSTSKSSVFEEKKENSFDCSDHSINDSRCGTPPSSLNNPTIRCSTPILDRGGDTPPLELVDISTIEQKENNESGPGLLSFAAPQTPTFSSDRTYSASQNRTATSGQLTIEVNPSFGFVEIGTVASLSMNISNNSDRVMVFDPRIIDIKFPHAPAFELTNRTRFTLEPHSSSRLIVRFTPRDQITYTAQLRLKRMNHASASYKFDFIGYGGKAQLEVMNGNCERIAVSHDGIGVLQVDEASGEAVIALTNTGIRSAYAYVVALTDDDRPLLNSPNIKITPQRLLIQAGKQFRKIRVHFPRDMVMKSRPPSSISLNSVRSTRTMNNEKLFRIGIYWGEERQRLRLKQYVLSTKNKKYEYDGLNFTTQFEGDSRAKLAANVVGIFDKNTFEQSMRVCRIQLVDNRVMRPEAPTLHIDDRIAYITDQHSDETLAEGYDKSINSRSITLPYEQDTLQMPTGTILSGRRVF